MKIACFIAGTDRPSSRFRVLQYIPYLKQEGIYCDIYAPTFPQEGISHSIFPGITFRLIKHCTQLMFYLPARFTQIVNARLQEYDAVLIQKPMMEWPPLTFFEKYITKINSNLIFDIDDAVFTCITRESSYRMRQVRKLAAYSKLVIAGNSYLADKMASWAKKVMILPTTVDELQFKPVASKRTDKICLGWTGTASNFHYLFDLIPVFEKFQNRNNLKIKIISNSSYIPELSHIKNIEFCKWNKETEIEDLQEFDIGLMPLRDEPWTRGKCAFKIVQYMAIGIPSVASPVGANKDVLIDGITGYFASTNSEWINKIDDLVKNYRLRTSLGAQALSRYRSMFSLASNVRKMISAFYEIQ